MRQIIAAPVVVEQGSDYEEDGAGKRVYTSFRSIPARLVLTAGNDFFRKADRKQPSIKKIWNIARRNASVARALYHYEKSEELVELRKVIEEIMNDTFTGTRPKKGNVPFCHRTQRFAVFANLCFFSMVKGKGYFLYCLRCSTFYKETPVFSPETWLNSKINYESLSTFGQPLLPQSVRNR